MLNIGDPAPEILVNSVSNQSISLHALRGKKVFVKFHRFSGCPVCQLQIHKVIKEQQILRDAGIETIVLLHSNKKNILSTFNETEGLHIIADKQKLLFKKFQVEFSLKKLFTFSTWRITFASIFKGYFPQFTRFEGGVIGIPADFLLDEHGTIKELNYGKHFGDSWSVAEVLYKASK
ncbi:MAG: redoxin domain-containing protein [Bacteroidetes bacterium]|nr:redoxin domain-containing protein [Bacteroidota bacterium]